MSRNKKKRTANLSPDERIFDAFDVTDADVKANEKGRLSARQFRQRLLYSFLILFPILTIFSGLWGLLIVNAMLSSESLLTVLSCHVPLFVFAVIVPLLLLWFDWLALWRAFRQPTEALAIVRGVVTGYHDDGDTTFVEINDTRYVVNNALQQDAFIMGAYYQIHTSSTLGATTGRPVIFSARYLGEADADARADQAETRLMDDARRPRLGALLDDQAQDDHDRA